MPKATSRRIRTPQEVRAEFERKGLSIAKWSIRNGFNPNLVSDLLNGRKKGLRGDAHRAAVALGLKDGVIVADRDIAGAIRG
jgi:gp16 family phage-associated protein